MLCPEIADLERFLVGGLDGGLQRNIENHVESCSSCATLILSIRENEGAAESIRIAFRGSGKRYTPPPESIGSYRIVRELGRGGMGVVYEAIQREPQRAVAVKVLHEGAMLDGHRVRLFRREAVALSRLQHASIASIYEAGRADDGRPYFVMEFVDGKPLGQFIQDSTPSLKERLRIFVAIGEAISYAHQRGVIHRDLKPSNVLVDGNGKPKILDFGLAKILAMDSSQPPTTSATEVGRVFGTLPYMSPEQTRGNPHDIDVRSDVYSLGVMLYELLTGRLPYTVQPANLANAARTICEQAPTPPSRWMREVRGDLETIVLKALEKEPARRYQSAGEFAADVSRFLDCRLIVARPATVRYQIQQFTRRNKALVASMVLSVVAMVGGTAAALGQAAAAIHERDVAERRLAYARQSANYLFAGVGSQLGSVLGTGDIRRHMTEEAYVFYDRLAQESPDDFSAQARLWSALRRIALQSLEIGDRERARALADLVGELVGESYELHPDEPILQREMMHLHVTLAMIAGDAEDVDMVERHVNRAADFCERLTSWYERNTDVNAPEALAVRQSGPEAGTMTDYVQVRRDWAFLIAGRLGGLMLDVDLNRAKELFLESSRLIDRLIEIDPTLEPIYQSDLSDYAPLAPPVLLRNGARSYYERTRAEIHAGLGTIAMRQGNLSEAEEHFLGALTIAESLHESAPATPTHIQLLAAAHQNMATLALASGDTSSAEAYAKQALLGHKRLADAEAKNVGWVQAVQEDLDFLAQCAAERK